MMEQIKRIVMIKTLERWYVKSSCAHQELELNTRKSFRFEVIFFVLVLAIALGTSGLLRGVVDINENTRSRSAFFGDNISDGEEFDYIVVGAGAAGSVVAARLTLAGLNVLLVEAGGDTDLLAKIPGVAIALTGSSMDWYYDTLPNNKSCLGYIGHRSRFTRGRCLGGSTSLNYMMYTRGNREDYDFNITGWTWKDIEPYFLKFEGFRDLHRLPKSSEPYHNTSGFVSIGYFGDTGNPWHSRLIEGLKELNFPHNPDVNAKSQIGVSQIPGFTSRGERVSTAKAYLEHRGVKKKLKIAKNTRCTRIIIDHDNVARGIIVSRGNNDVLQLYAKNEVVLSAGSIGTAQLLLLSGVGPKLHLKELGISVRADLPVGEEMSDHIMPLSFIKVDSDVRTFLHPLSIATKGLQALQWIARRSGLLSTISLTDITAFFNTHCYNYTLRRLINDRPECEIPTTQLIHAYADKGSLNFIRTILKATTPYFSDISDQVSNNNDDYAFIVASPVVLRPKSRGSIQLASIDPLEPPIIRPNYLDDERDVQEMVRGLRMLEQLVETPMYKKYNASILKIKFPACPEIDSDTYWECYARHMTHSAQHAMGTAALGTVLDERLRVRGIKNLRVGDASVFPELPRGNTAAAIIAVGERLSDFLIQDQIL